MKPEIFFLKYAYPCSFVLLIKKEITNEEHELLHKSTKEKKLYLPRKRIERIFWRPMKFIKSISNLKEVQEYWWFKHNQYLMTKNRENVEEIFIKRCMVIPCEVLSVEKNVAMVISPLFKEMIKLKTDFVDVKPRDKVTKHYDYVCEKISENLYEEIIKRLKNIMD
jgi:hydrogenase maturation factor